MREFFRRFLSGEPHPSEATDSFPIRPSAPQDSLLSAHIQKIEADLAAQQAERDRIEKERLDAENELLATFENVVAPAILKAEAAFESQVPPGVIALCEEMRRKIEREEGANFKKTITFILKDSSSERFDEHYHKKGEDIVDPRNSDIKKGLIKFYRENGSIPVKRMVIRYGSEVPVDHPHSEIKDGHYYFNFDLSIDQDAVNNVFASQEKTAEYVQKLAERFAEIFVHKQYKHYVSNYDGSLAWPESGA